MKNRSYTLLLNGIFYSFTTVILLVAAIIKMSLPILNAGVISLAIMSISVVLAFIIDEEEKPNNFILGVSFALLLPVGILIFVFTFIATFISNLFKRHIKRGGDYDD